MHKADCVGLYSVPSQEAFKAPVHGPRQRLDLRKLGLNGTLLSPNPIPQLAGVVIFSDPFRLYIYMPLYDYLNHERE